MLWGIRVVVPQKFRNDTIKMLHEVHASIVRMKEITRSSVWWLGLDQEIEAVAKACVDCQAVKSAPAKAPLHPWIWPDKPWLWIHVDFTGPFQGRMFLLIVDAHSQWPEVREVRATTTAKTIEFLRQLFCTYGLPEQLVSDNGPSSPWMNLPFLSSRMVFNTSAQPPTIWLPMVQWNDWCSHSNKP